MGEERNIKLVLQYDGTAYQGWQRQKEDPTIQQVVEDCLLKILQQPITLIASGRTDTGVHALHQVCHYKTQSLLEPRIIIKALNSLLPRDIRVIHAEYMPLSFHARYNVKSKIYEYRILNRPEPDLFQRQYIWHIPQPLDQAQMIAALDLLIGKNDFSSFRSSGSGNLNPVREIFRAELQPQPRNVFFLVFEADGFLRHMVRNMVGTLVEIGKGKITVQEFKDIFAARDRCLAGFKAPAQGLFLKMVFY